jgi:hypothetical protein
LFLAIVALITLTLAAPAAAQVGKHPIAAAPASPSWDERSGYGAVETSRANFGVAAAPMNITSLVPSDVRWAPANATADLAPVVPMYIVAAQRALQTSDPGSLAEEALLRLVAGFAAWDEMSGYGSVEASRATVEASALGHGNVTGPTGREERAAIEDGTQTSGHEASAAISASWDEASGYGSLEASRATGEIAVAATEITSLVPADVRWAPAPFLGYALTPLAAVAIARDETSGYGSVAVSRASR